MLALIGVLTEGGVDFPYFPVKLAILRGLEGVPEI